MSWKETEQKSFEWFKTTGELRKQSSTNNITWHILIERE